MSLIGTRDFFIVDFKCKKMHTRT